MSAVVEIVDLQLAEGIHNLEIQDQADSKETCSTMSEVKIVGGCGTDSINIDNHHHGDCAVCLNKILLQEMALVKGCEHAYCITCILRWASCKKEATCPQCKQPFEFLNVHRSLDGSIYDYMFEESVCLLLRASWFSPLALLEHEEVPDEIEDYYYDDDDEDLDEVYLGSSSNLRIGNRRWGDNGYVRAGRQEARPIPRLCTHYSVAGPSNPQPKKEAAPHKELVGRRAKRALKREAADRAAAAKHQHHLDRLGRK